MMCACHDPGVFGHVPPCCLAPPRPSRVLADKGNGQAYLITTTTLEAR